jgi:hypothetical protein
MGFYQEPSMKYKIIIIYEYLKLRYYNKSGNSAFVLNCIPIIFYRYYLSHKTGHYEYGHECINKQYFYRILSKHNLPFPETYFIISNGKIKDLDNNYIPPQHIDSDRNYFAKTLSGSCGKGACIIKGKEIDIGKYDEYIIQDVCTNHKLIKKLAPNKSFNTIRIHSYYSNKHSRMVILTAYLKLGIQNSIIDNVGTGGIGVPINLETGKLNKYGFSEFANKEYEKYPGSNVKFENFSLPYWDTIIEMLDKAVRIFKTRFIGWDIGITDEGVVFVEANSGGHYFIMPQGYYTSFYDTLLITDHIAEADYHKWILKYNDKYNKLFNNGQLQ